jgi:hypothetical protein
MVKPASTAPITMQIPTMTIMAAVCVAQWTE